ncbi:hypothetical protein KY330_01000 [Candidatus Woesearchaeota archaeon]|nr:hypothetical protein [Candidatus Woesearchaeota archaeon]
MAAKKETKKEIFYVGVKDPIEIRRTLLESSKEMVHAMQRYERFKEVRKEKIDEVQNLKEIISEIKKLANKLKQLLPETELRIKANKEKVNMLKKKSANKQKTEIKKAQVIEKPLVMPKPRATSELEKLEAELANIENKLGKLV